MKETVHIIQAPPFWLKTPPLSLIYLKNYLKSKGINVKILDLNFTLYKHLNYPLNNWLGLDDDFENNLFSMAEKNAPLILESLYEEIKNSSFIGFSLLKRNTPFSFELAKRIKDRFPDKKIIFGGPHALTLKEKNKISPSDYWIIGEGEQPLYEVLTKEKPHISCFKELSNLDSLPFLDFEPLNPLKYSRSLPLLSSRGCPYACNFCSERLLSHKFRHHSPKYIVEQIKYLISKYEIRNFVFCDSLINYKTQWLEELCQLLIKNNLSIKWEAQARIKPDFPQELAYLLKKSGCFNLFVGLENGSDRMLTLMNKGFNSIEAVEFLRKLKTADLHFEISLIFGYPQEEEKDYFQTLEFIKDNKNIIPKIAQVNPFVDYLGEFKDKFPTPQGLRRVLGFIKFLQNEKIRYTKSFINNLIYES